MTTLRSALVTGATGFVGAALVRRLLTQDIEVTCLVRAGRGTHFSPTPGLRVVETSFHSAELGPVLRECRPDVVFHLASYGVHQRDRDPELLLDGNVRLLVRLLQAAAGRDLRRFIHAGSCSEYGAPPMAAAPIMETAPLRPISLYGAAKAAAFLYGSSLATAIRVPFVTLRLFNVYGAGEAPQRLTSYIGERLRHGEPVNLTPGEQLRDFLYVDDVAEAFLAAAHSDRLDDTAYNVCSGQPVSVRALGEAIADALDRPRHLLEWGRRPYRPDEPMALVGDNRRFTAATAWRPRVTLADGVRRLTAADRRPSGARHAV